MVSRIFPLIFIIIAFSNEKNTLWIYRSNRILLQIVTIVSHHGREICRMFWLRRDKVGRHMDMKKERQTGIWAWDLLTWKSSRVNCSEHSTPVLPADSICWLKLRWPWTWNVAFEHSLEDDRVPPALQKGRCLGWGPGTRALVRCSAFIRGWKTSSTKREEPWGSHGTQLASLATVTKSHLQDPNVVVHYFPALNQQPGQWFTVIFTII